MKDSIIVRACQLRNFGDTLNSELVRLISGETPRIVNNTFKNPNNETIYMAIGSVLGWCDSNTIVWGSGFISNSQHITTIKAPKKICAVRGPMTRDILLKKGINCPEIFGDPALLMPRFYQPNTYPVYELGIICHHIDKILLPQLKKHFPYAHFIDIQDDVYKVIDEVCKCQKIASSALHGLIIADSYHIPNIWIKLSEKILGYGFKFQDYFSSVKREDKEPLIITFKTHLKNINNKFYKYHFPQINLKPLWETCPFKKGNNNEGNLERYKKI